MLSTEARTGNRSEVETLPVAARLEASRRESDRLFEIVKPGALYERPIPERHRIVFYMGHLEAFDWNLLREHLPGLKSFHPEFDQLFAFGIDPIGGGLPDDQHKDWPSLDRIRQYQAKIRQMLDTALDGVRLGAERTGGPARNDKGNFSLDVLLNVAIEHRLMHAETLAYMFHQLSPHQKIRSAEEPAGFTYSGAGPHRIEMIEVPAGKITLGLDSQDREFGWDNEFEAHTIEVPGFEIDRHQVTNRQFLEFMADGGYERAQYWSPADWAWKNENQISHPAFWKSSGDDWAVRTMFGESPLRLLSKGRSGENATASDAVDWPVYVSHAEASAYARWAGKSLPTESEWQRAAYGSPQDFERPYPWGVEAPAPRHGNFNFHRWDPAPVHAFPDGDSAWGVSGLLGNGWEWTSSVFEPFPGFQPFPFYPGYSANFFDGEHYVMKGGSARTAGCMLRRSFRNWFQPHYPYVYAGFRCVNR